VSNTKIIIPLPQLPPFIYLVVPEPPKPPPPPLPVFLAPSVAINGDDGSDEL
jgi:hypothetical protein